MRFFLHVGAIHLEFSGHTGLYIKDVLYIKPACNTLSSIEAL